jgi:hypothetical protein
MAAINFPFEVTPLSPPIASATTCDLARWVLDSWSTWRRPDGDGERLFNADELLKIRAAVERIAWCGTRVH